VVTIADMYGSCPCGSGESYARCCGPLHHGQRQARTAEELMRSRYAAYALGDTDYVFRTWHPRTRPSDLTLDAGTEWTGLEVMDRSGGGPDDEHGEVAFTARFTADGRDGVLRERSRFRRRAGRWLYVDAVDDRS
jgi:SEC-C motif domain protein